MIRFGQMSDRRDAVRSSRVVGVEGLRAIAAASIVVYHVWLYGAPNQQSVNFGEMSKVFDNLRAGVTLFFVLSGFLLFRPYVAAALRGLPTPSLRQYLRNRFLRIAPAYWFILCVTGMLLEPALIRHPAQFVANAFLLQNYVPSYIFGNGIVPAWSLCIEVVFYLWVPALGGLAIVLARRRGVRPAAAAFAPVAAMVMIGFGAKVIARLVETGVVWRFSFLTHADWFAAGMAVAVLRILWEDGRLSLPRFWRPVAALAAPGLLVFGMALYYPGTLNYVEYQTPIALGCALVLALVVFADPNSRLIRLLASRPLVAVGLGSYSLFLWHDPVLRWLRGHGATFPGKGGFLLNILVVALIAGIASAVSYRFVEKPALARKRRWQRDAPPVAAPGVRQEPESAISTAAPAISNP